MLLTPSKMANRFDQAPEDLPPPYDDDVNKIAASSTPETGSTPPTQSAPAADNDREPAEPSTTTANERSDPVPDSATAVSFFSRLRSFFGLGEVGANHTSRPSTATPEPSRSRVQTVTVTDSFTAWSSEETFLSRRRPKAHYSTTTIYRVSRDPSGGHS